MYSTALQVLRGCLAKFHCEREICIQNLELRLWQSFGCGDFAVAETPKPGTSWQLGLTRQRFGPIRIGKICVMRQFVSICSDKSSPAFSSSRKVFLFFLPKANTPCIPRTDRSPRRRRACIGRTLYLHLARTRGGLMGSILLCKVENQISRFFVISRPSTSDSWLYLTCIFFISVFWFCSVMYVVSRHRLNLCDAWVRLRLWFGFHQGRSIVGDEGRLAESFCGGSDFVL